MYFRTLITLLIFSLPQASTLSLAKEISETTVKYIPLAPPLDRAKAQFSSLAWCQNSLLLLPERPWFEIAPDNPDPKESIATYVYQLSREQIDNYLSGKTKNALKAKKLALKENGIRKKINNFDGYEAIACSGTDIWLSIETEVTETLFETNIVRAKFDTQSQRKEISIGPTVIHKIHSQSGIKNYSDEALLINNQSLVSIHEANDTHRTKPSFATSIDIDTGARSELAFPPIAYRITDATQIDKNGYFWGTNYGWSGESEWFSGTDFLADKYGLGASHKLENTIERLVEFRLHDDRIELVDRAPIQLTLTQEDGRNWEGIARYGKKGLLLITDQYPRTLMGFVEFNTRKQQSN